MKVVVAIDSLKGSLTSMEAGYAVREGIHRVMPEAEVIVKPLADGGEGTTDAFITGLGAKRIDLTVTGPMGQPVDTYYGYLEESNTAILEMASAAGITLTDKETRDPFTATTYGVGTMIKDAIQKGCNKFIIGIGGSATNDGGIGMLKALGFDFLDEDGEDVGEGGQALAKVCSIRSEGVDTILANCQFNVACDVKNPLCGPNGATYIYGPQKGVTVESRATLDAGMEHFARITSDVMGNDYKDAQGAGAAGGLGFAFLSYLEARLISGIELVVEAVQLERELKDADIVVTGEGRLDNQTAMGKAPVGVAKLAKRYGAKVLAFAGSVTKGAKACNAEGIDAFFPIVRGVTTLEEAMDADNAKENMVDSVEQVFRLL